MPITLLAVATDEDLAKRAGGDWSRIVPAAQLLAYGTDGVITAGARWTLTSASVDFGAQGLAAGNVVILDKGVPIKGDQLAVDTLAAPAVILRRIDQASGKGQPPGAGAGSTGITFRCLYAAPQIEQATYQVQRRFNILTAGDLQDPTELREAVVNMALVELYELAMRQGDGKDEFQVQLRLRMADLKAELDRLDALYGTARLGSLTVSAPMVPSVPNPLFPY